MEVVDDKEPKDPNKITQNKEVDVYPAKTFKVPFAPDMLMVYSTVEGKCVNSVSWESTCLFLKEYFFGKKFTELYIENCVFTLFFLFFFYLLQKN